MPAFWPFMVSLGAVVVPVAVSFSICQCFTVNIK